MFWERFFSWIDNRSKVQFYAVFALVWTFLHWQTLVILFFTSESAISATHDGMLKNEYIKEYANIFGNHSLFGLDAYWSNFLLCFLVSIIVAALSIWVLPKWLLQPAYGAEREHELNKDLIDLRKKQKFEEEKVALIKAKEQKLDAEISLSKKEDEAKNTDPSIFYEEEYDDFRYSEFYSEFSKINKVLYENNGEWKDILSTSAMGYFYSNGLIRFIEKYDVISGQAEKESFGKQIWLTKKGRDFLKRYMDDNGGGQ